MKKTYMKMKKFMSVVLSLLMCFSFVACGGDEDDSGKTKIRISFFQAGFGDEWIKATAAEYEKLHPDVKIIPEGSDSMDDTVRARYQAGLNARNYPDIVSVTNTAYYNDYIRNGYVENLDSLYEAEVENGNKLKDVIAPNFLDVSLVQGSRYGVPWEGAVTGFAYNKKLFEQNGWEIPKTMDAFFALCAKIKAKGINPVVYCGGTAEGYFGNLFLSWFAQYEGKESTEEFFRLENSDAYRKKGRLEAYRQVAKIVADENVRMAGSNGMNHLAAQRAFIRGEAAMIPAGSWLQTEMSAFLAGYPNFEMAMFPVPSILADGDGNPVDKNGNPALTVSTGNYDLLCVSAHSPNKEIAKDFLLFMSRQDMLELYVEKTGGNTRPFKIENTDWSSLTAFGKSLMEIWQSAYNIFPYSAAELFQHGDIGINMAQNGRFCTYMQSASNVDAALGRAQDLYDKDIQTAELKGLQKP